MEKLAYFAALPDQELKEMLDKKDLRQFKKILFHLFPEVENSLNQFGDLYLSRSLDIISSFKQEYRVQEYKAILKSLIVAHRSSYRVNLDLRLYQFAYQRKILLERNKQQPTRLGTAERNHNGTTHQG